MQTSRGKNNSVNQKSQNYELKVKKNIYYIFYVRCNICFSNVPQSKIHCSNLALIIFHNQDESLTTVFYSLNRKLFCNSNKNYQLLHRVLLLLHDGHICGCLLLSGKHFLFLVFIIQQTQSCLQEMKHNQ